MIKTLVYMPLLLGSLTGVSYATDDDASMTSPELKQRPSLKRARDDSSDESSRSDHLRRRVEPPASETKSAASESNPAADEKSAAYKHQWVIDERGLSAQQKLERLLAARDFYDLEKAFEVVDVKSRSFSFQPDRLSRTDSECLNDLFDLEWNEVGNTHEYALRSAAEALQKWRKEKTPGYFHPLTALSYKYPDDPIICLVRALVEKKLGDTKQAKKFEDQANGLLTLNFIAHQVYRTLGGPGTPKSKAVSLAEVRALDALHPNHPLLSFAEIAIERISGDEKGTQEAEAKAKTHLESYEGPLKSAMTAMIYDIRHAYPELRPHALKFVNRFGWFDPAFYYRCAMACQFSSNEEFVAYLDKAVYRTPTYAPALCELGFWSLNGLGNALPQNTWRGLHLLHRAADAKHGRAQLELAQVYQRGREARVSVRTSWSGFYEKWATVIQANPEDSAFWYAQVFLNPKAIAGHRGIASRELATLFSQVTSQKQTILNAVATIEKRAEEGDSLSQYLAASFHAETGDATEALGWCAKFLSNTTTIDEMHEGWLMRIVEQQVNAGNATAQFLQIAHHLKRSSPPKRDFIEFWGKKLLANTQATDAQKAAVRKVMGLFAIHA